MEMPPEEMGMPPDEMMPEEGVPDEMPAEECRPNEDWIIVRYRIAL
jgi:hypothetical protein